MTNPDDVADIGNLLNRLRDADTGKRVFGSDLHGYRLGSVLSEAELAAFESVHGVRLPEDYRRFLATCGNGGAGPFLGLHPLGACGDLSRPFPFTRATDQLTQEELRQFPDPFLDYPGLHALCDQGCDGYSYLVVNGPAYGTVWDSGDAFWPTNLTFGVWYRRWLERALRNLENERRLPRLRVGMSRAEVLAAVGGEWEARPVDPMPPFSESDDLPAQLVLPAGRRLWLFESIDFPAQLVLDDRDRVVQIIPDPFIPAIPNDPFIPAIPN